MKAVFKQLRNGKIFLSLQKKTMETDISKRWNLMAINGAIAIIFGALAIFVPQATLVTLVTYFGIIILLLAVAMLIGVFMNIKNGLGYGTDLAEAIVLLVIGVLLTFYTTQSLKVFVIVIGSWGILIGLMQLFFAFKVSPDLNGKTTLLINGGLTILFGIVLFFNPFQVAEIFVVLIGILAILVGTILVVLAIKMKNFFKGLEE